MPYIFLYLEPKDGVLPGQLAVQFFEVLHRARKLVEDRTTEEIRAGAKILRMIPNHPEFRDPDYEAFTEVTSALTLPNGEVINAIPAYDEVTKLTRNIGNVRLASSVGFKKAHWFEIFAILSLTFADRAAFIDSVRKEGAREISDSEADEEIRELTEKAKRALDVAERLKSETLKRSEGGKKVHSKLDPLKDAVLQLAATKYLKKTNRDAAKRIVQELLNSHRLAYDEKTNHLDFDGKRVATTDDPEARFAKWIGRDRGPSLKTLK